MEKTKAQLEQEIEELKANLKENKACSVKADTDNEMKKKAEAWLEEEVQIVLFKDGEKYKDDLVIGLNGTNVVIKRGIPQKIKRKYALLIEQSQYQEIVASDTIANATEDYKNAEKIGAI